MNKYLLILILFFAGCVSMPKPKAIVSSPVVEQITFDEIDLNEDGDITETEVKQFNKNISALSNQPQLSLPIWATAGIILLTLVMCAVSTFMRCNKSE